MSSFLFSPILRNHDSDLSTWLCLRISAAGELSVRVIDSLLGARPKLWEFSGKTGTEEGAWQHVDLPIGARKDRFQVSFFFFLRADIIVMLTLMMRFHSHWWLIIIFTFDIFALMMRVESQIWATKWKRKSNHRLHVSKIPTTCLLTHFLQC